MQQLSPYRPVVFLAAGEDGVCGGRHFSARRSKQGGFDVSEGGAVVLHAANLGEIRDGVMTLVNGVTVLNGRLAA